MDLSQIASLVASHAWIALAALVIGALVRLTKSDAPLPIPPSARPWLALALGVASGALDALVAGEPLIPALIKGLVAAVTAMGAHDAVIESARGGRELFEKKPPPPMGPSYRERQDAVAESDKPPPPVSARRQTLWFVPPMLNAFVLAAAIFLAGCARLLSPPVVQDEKRIAICVVDHLDEPPEQIVADCVGATLPFVLDMLASHQRVNGRILLAHPNMCAVPCAGAK